MQIQQAYSKGTDSRNMQQSADWLRLVECIFQGIPSVTLQCYVVILSQETTIVRVAAIVLGMISMSINVAIIFGEDQPGAPAHPPSYYVPIVYDRPTHPGDPCVKGVGVPVMILGMQLLLERQPCSSRGRLLPTRVAEQHLGRHMCKYIASLLCSSVSRCRAASKLALPLACTAHAVQVLAAPVQVTV